jgi:hypothetical protein
MEQSRQQAAVAARLMRDQQASRILDLLDEIEERIELVTDANTRLRIVRHPELGTFRGTSTRDALAQMLQAADLPPETERNA